MFTHQQRLRYKLTPDGKGEFGYMAQPMEGVPMPPPMYLDARFYGTTE